MGIEETVPSIDQVEFLQLGSGPTNLDGQAEVGVPASLTKLFLRETRLGNLKSAINGVYQRAAISGLVRVQASVCWKGRLTILVSRSGVPGGSSPRQ